MAENEAAMWDVVVVGAGPAGLMAAIGAARRGRRTLLLEKNRKTGVKILMSGGTRCNLTQATDARGICEAFGPQGRFLRGAVGRFGPQQLVDMVEAQGVATKVEPTGKIFPESDRAADVLDAFLRHLKETPCNLELSEAVTEIRPAPDGFQLTTGRRVITAARVLLTTGGQSFPGCGTTGDGYRLAAALGHTIHKPRVALVPVTTAVDWIPPLQGLTIPDVGVKVVETALGEPAAPRTLPAMPRTLAECRGSFLFTHFGLSGPAVLNVSRAVSGHPNRRQLTLECDFLPGMKDHQLDDELRQRLAAAGKRQVAGLLADLVPQRLGETILSLAEVTPQTRAAELSKSARQRVQTLLKHLPVPVTGTLGFEKAEVTAGGVDLAEVDPRTMQSKLQPGLFLAGEVLDVDGPIGGYNFQAAFSTGWLAGENV